MWTEFATSRIDKRDVLDGVASPETIADAVAERVTDGSLRHLIMTQPNPGTRPPHC